MLIPPLARAACRPGLQRLRATPLSSPLTRVFATSPIHRKDAHGQRAAGAPTAPKKAVPAEPFSKADKLLAEQLVSNKEQRKADWAIMKEMTSYLWPKDSFGTRLRVGLSVGLLIGAKLLNVQIPFYFKSIVDSMNIDFLAVGGTAWTVAGSMIVACKLVLLFVEFIKHVLRLSDGVTRMGATLFQEMRNAVFASVAQKAIRRVACSVYGHLLKLDLNFHLSRQTGGLTRALDRGTKGISFLLTSMVFHILPTALEISLVCGILVCSTDHLPRTSG